MRDQLCNLLANGATREEAIKILGCADSYIKECLEDKNFLAEIREKRESIRQELIEQSYAKLEQSTLKNINKEVDSGMVDVATQCRILETVAKNRILHRNPAGHFNNQTLHLTVDVRYPAAAGAQNVTIDEKTGQILAIGERSMAAMPIQGVQKLFKGLEEEKILAKAAKMPVETLSKAEERATIDADINETSVEVPYGNQTNETASIRRAA